MVYDSAKMIIHCFLNLLVLIEIHYFTETFNKAYFKKLNLKCMLQL